MSLHHRQDGYAAPTADERREAQLLEELRELGYRISVSCRVCGHPVVKQSSVAAHLGPKCAVKLAEEVGE